MASRREKIEMMLQEEPRDVFLRYSLAMEYCSEGNLPEGIKRFEELAKEIPPHAPSCFMGAQRYVELDDLDRARALLRKGIEAARAQGDRHAAAEMSDYLASLGELGE
jgi:tetratricopeptide (TPR) repeat protein